MNSEQQFDKTEIYQIKIKGFLDDKWSGWFESFTITHQGEKETMLIGSVSDQEHCTACWQKSEIWDFYCSQLNVYNVNIARSEG